MNGHPNTKGMTLPEVLVAAVLGSMLLLCLAAAAGNVFQVYREGANEANRSRDAAFSLDVLARQIRNASDASLTNSRTLVLTDPSAANTTFSWSGTAGDPMTMEAGTPEVWPLLDGVKDLSFQLFTKNVDVQNNQSTNTELINFDNYAGYEHWSYVNLSTTTLCGVEFVVPASEEIEGIRLTNVFLRMGKIMGQNGDLTMYLVDTECEDVPYPLLPYIASQTIPNSDIIWAVWDSMWKFDWFEITFDPGFTVYPNRHYILGFRSLGPGESCLFRLRCLLSSNQWYGWGSWNPPPGPDNGIRYMDSFDSGATWWPDFTSQFEDAVDAPIVLYGDVVRKVTNTQTVVTAVEVSVVLDDNGKDRLLFRREQLQGGI